MRIPQKADIENQISFARNPPAEREGHDGDAEARCVFRRKTSDELALQRLRRQVTRVNQDIGAVADRLHRAALELYAVGQGAFVC